MRFIRLTEVINKVGLSKSQIYQLVAEGNFPKQVRISARAVAWKDFEIEEWMCGRMG